MTKLRKRKQKRKKMDRRMWRHLAIGIALFTLSAWLWLTGKYTYEIACMIALLTIVWLYDRD